MAEGESIPLEVRTVVGVVIVRTATGVDSHDHWVVDEGLTDGGDSVEEGGIVTIEEEGGTIFSLSTMKLLKSLWGKGF